MARELTGRLRVVGRLVAQTPLHVGGLGDDVDTDLPLARDGRGRYYVPGSSLAGALRAWCEEVFEDRPDILQRAWGFQKDEDGSASRIVVEDAVLPEAEAEVRDGVGIDRIWGCAAEYIKYDRAVLPRGTSLPLEMTVELQGDSTAAVKEMVDALIAALKRGEVRLGAARTRGLGRLKLADEVTVTEVTLSTRLGILDALRGKWAAHVPSPLTDRARARLEVTIDWHPVGPLMVKAGLDGVGVDMLPLVSAADGRLAPVVPGSSIKGVLRGQAERIVRTMLGTPADPALEGKRRFLTHTRVPLVEELFGAPGRPRKDEKEKQQREPKPSDRLGLGALAVDDCYANRFVSADAWREIVFASPDAEKGQAQSPLRRALDAPAAGLEGWTAAYHVAVDRWTGGAAEGFLYTVLEPHGVAWDPIRLEIDPGRLRGCQADAITLLLLVLRDLAAGQLPLGFATHRGLGALAVTNVSFAAVRCDPPLADLGGKSLPGGDPTSLPEKLRKELSSRWRQWLDTNGVTP